MDEEVILLEEQLAAAHGDIERLQTRVGELEAQSAGRETELVELRRRVEAGEMQLTQRDQEIEALHADLEAADARARGDAARYRDAVLAQAPDLPADLVTGDSVAEIDEALVRARQTVAQVRQHLEQQAQALRVPAGAPVRSAPDLSALSASEKIRLGLQQA